MDQIKNKLDNLQDFGNFFLEHSKTLRFEYL
jgi:hypothetical protein